MPGKVIGDTLPIGFAGNPSRMSDCVIAPYMYAASNSGNIQFGEPVAFDSVNGGVRKVTSGDSSSDIIGIAVRRMGQPHADTPDGWYYKPGDEVDVLLRGSITVPVLDATSIAARGSVYVCNGTGSNRPAGSIVCASAGDTIAISNGKFSTGKIDATDKVAEITLTERVI